MTDVTELQRRAQRKLASIELQRADKRYRKVIGRLVAEGLLITNQAIKPYRRRIDVANVLWVGTLEPRCLELLPALLVKRPGLFTQYETLPDDLAAAVRRLRRNLAPDAFRGIPGERLMSWLPRVGRKGRVPSRLKSFRLHADELELLATLAAHLGVTETEVLRRGLQALQVLTTPPKPSA
jgi:hypothetical protein